MSDYHSQTRSVPIGREEMAIDPGLRRFMLGVYIEDGPRPRSGRRRWPTPSARSRR